MYSDAVYNKLESMDESELNFAEEFGLQKIGMEVFSKSGFGPFLDIGTGFSTISNNGREMAKYNYFADAETSRETIQVARRQLNNICDQILIARDYKKGLQFHTFGYKTTDRRTLSPLMDYKELSIEMESSRGGLWKLLRQEFALNHSLKEAYIQMGFIRPNFERGFIERFLE
ncbi:MAG: hypothetical protein ACMXYF_01215 [Candidatus Woesearchaeota archaeon]